ncbi:hypothetical protein C497_07104 [Halalkalicoccus jeotgali B3]|uniref:Uncharacterized protein n=1 Tax=Halalkalicoccus jeotgali (strain DSM 18796 / CECT 7217 / JCM 14584 / KCTC 4019 / B3) TaxID=795797 RepID=D8JCY0_HALJB|nr:hypothetical protein HacjB3_17663 [Halalkalicoccus jeotgali B3]ELY38689.1 hypothetical protein C497_07104 [Halalkalicoccus jeotgali B3]
MQDVFVLEDFLRPLEEDHAHLMEERVYNTSAAIDTNDSFVSYVHWRDTTDSNVMAKEWGET